MHVVLVGAGLMAKEYGKVLNALGVPYTVISRGPDSAKTFEAEVDKEVLIGGLESNYGSLEKKPTHVIIATPLENLEENTLFILDQGVKNVLIEKPGAVSVEGLKRIHEKAEYWNAKVFIAYNRRFYSSVMEAEKLIAKDGGLQSFVFEFTEWGHKIKSLDKSKFQLQNWFIGNSTHVIDLAFFFGGKPKEFSSYIMGGSDWHPTGTIFSGAGITETGKVFSYHANWEAPGSWKLELLTKLNRYIFRPLEELKVQALGSIEVSKITIDDSYDITFKPGLYQQVNSFLYETPYSNRLLGVEEGLLMMENYFRMRCDK
jgi:predicted dehydrogenase